MPKSSDADDLQPRVTIEPRSLLAVAVFFGKTRLIDNILPRMKEFDFVVIGSGIAGLDLCDQGGEARLASPSSQNAKGWTRTLPGRRAAWRA